MTTNDHLRVASSIVDIFYTRFQIGTMRVGLYLLFTPIPELGDIFSLLLSFYIFWISAQYKMPFRARTQMVWNVILDLGMGAIPFAGDIADTVFRAHVRNIAIIKKYAQAEPLEATYATSRLSSSKE